MQRSFSVVEDDTGPEDYDDDDEQVLKKYGSALGERRASQNGGDFGKNLTKLTSAQSLTQKADFDSDSMSHILSAGPSGRQTVLQSRFSGKKTGLSSESDPDDSDLEEEKAKVPGEYNPQEYETLEVNAEIRELFQYITKYIPQQMNLDYKFKPFVPEFLPAVGDIDAFLKVIPPSGLGSAEDFVSNQQLGLVVLDEPAANQSDAALLHLQLRAESVKTTHDGDVVVKKIDNVEKNVKTIDKWIKDITALHKSKSFPSVRYTEQMPDLDELMQEWPEEMEKKLKSEGFPQPNGTLEDYIEEVCQIFQIPVKDKIQSLHLLFSLYAAVRSSQLYKNTQIGKDDDETTSKTDHLVLK